MTPENIYHSLELVREKNPLVHNITNYVAMNAIANVLLALGASPLMAHDETELEEILQIAGALVINIGTLDAAWIQSMRAAQKIALQKSIPIILDPVGAGATKLRTQTTRELLSCGVHIVRGNASEIMALVGQNGATKGVDSTERSDAAIEAANTIANDHGCTVVVSGEIDIITDGKKIYRVQNGTPLFTKVTAMGCSSTAVIGAFAAVNNKNMLVTATHAMSVFTLAGEKAEKKSRGPGTFFLNLLDELAALTQHDFNSIKVTC